MAIETRKTVTTEVKIVITESDIIRWICNCDDPKVLRKLGKLALRLAKNIENPDTDDWRSRA